MLQPSWPWLSGKAPSVLGAQLTPADRVMAAGLRDAHRLDIIELRDRLASKHAGGSAWCGWRAAPFL